jgi:hypothetical protein
MTELRMLKVQDVDVNAPNGRVTGKYGKTRVVLLTQRAADALRTYIAGRTIGYVFQQDYPLQTGTFAESGGVWIARWKDYAIDRPRYTLLALGLSALPSRRTVLPAGLVLARSTASSSAAGLRSWPEPAAGS